MVNVEFNELSKEMLSQLKKGAFLTVKNEDKLNTMTIGWGSLGFIWNVPVFMVPVRYSRYTYEMIEKTDEFTVSVPLKGDMAKELAFCGSKSGREVDKFKELNLTAKEAQMINTPIIEECELHFECKIVYKQAMNPEFLDQAIDDTKYPNDNYHVLYYGEIKACYLTK